jgi:hypothetical protein
MEQMSMLQRLRGGEGRKEPGYSRGGVYTFLESVADA